MRPLPALELVALHTDFDRLNPEVDAGGCPRAERCFAICPQPTGQGRRLLLPHSRRRPPEVMITSGARPTSSAAEARIWLRFAARGHPAALAEALDSWPH